MLVTNGLAFWDACIDIYFRIYTYNNITKYILFYIYNHPSMLALITTGLLRGVFKAWGFNIFRVNIMIKRQDANS